VLTRSIALHVAEALAVPCVCVHLCASDTPTGAFPPPDMLGSLRWLSRRVPRLEPWLNKLLYTVRGLQIVRAAVSSGLARSDQALRAAAGLPAADPLVGLADIQEQPALHAYSRVIQPRPADWPACAQVVGFWRLAQREPTGAAAAELLALDQWWSRGGNGPVLFVGFGSMRRVRDLLTHFLAAVREYRADLRCVVAASPEQLASPGDERLFVCRGNLDHDALFPRCRAVVHHGGAGTTAAVLRAGVPSVVVPVLAWSDQPYWASRVEASGAGVAADPRAVLASPAAAAAALELALQPACAQRAKALAAALAAEERELGGARGAATTLLAYLAAVA
jgi:UDP:flavonoid glycosyltransferase YjiC (YdhE family)